MNEALLKQFTGGETVSARIPFEHIVPPERRDDHVKATLRDPELSGAALLACALRGCLEWQRERGLGGSGASAHRGHLRLGGDFLDVVSLPRSGLAL